MIRFLLAAVLAAALGVADAHAHLAASTPVTDAVITADEAPSAIALEFTEGVELAFSTFKLLSISHELDTRDPTFQMRLNALAAQKAQEVLATRGEVEGEIGFELEPARGTVEAFELVLDEALPPGSYVLMWRLLSVDTHIMEEFITFTVLP